MKVILPIELEAKSLRVVMKAQLLEAEWVKGRYEQLLLSNEKRLKALYHVQGYQRSMA
jgi:hypothetical protein